MCDVPYFDVISSCFNKVELTQKEHWIFSENQPSAQECLSKICESLQKVQIVKLLPELKAEKVMN